MVNPHNLMQEKLIKQLCLMYQYKQKIKVGNRPPSVNSPKNLGMNYVNIQLCEMLNLLHQSSCSFHQIQFIVASNKCSLLQIGCGVSVAELCLSTIIFRW